MKRLTMIVALAAALAGGAACSSNTPSPTSTTTTPAATTMVTTAAKPTANPVAPTDDSNGQPDNQQHEAPAPNPAPNPNPAPDNQGDKGADGSTGNNLSKQYCAQNQDPGCPAGSYVGPNAIPNPNGEGNYVPCEGTICTNPNHGAGTDPNENGGDVTTNPDSQGRVAGAPCEGDGKWVHLEGGNAAHYGTDWMCQH